MKKKKVILLLVLFFIIMLLVTRVVIADTTLENEKKLKLAALSLASSNNITKIGEDLPNLFHVEMDGEGSAVAVGYFTMWARNVKDENQIVHITVVGDIMHVRDLVSKSLLTNGTYYISDVFINPHLPESSDYVRYSKDLSVKGALPLDYNVEFKIEGIEPHIKLTNLSLASSNNTTKIGEDLSNLFYVQINGKEIVKFDINEDVEYMTMFARNVEDNNQIAHITLVSDRMHIRDMISKTPLTNGTYYISDVFLNPHLPESSDYIIYSKDLSIENALPLDYYVEFEIIVNENVDNSVDIKEPENKHENVDVSNSVDIEEPENKAENIDVNNVVDVEKTENTNNIKDNNKDNNKVNSDKVKEVSNTKNTSVVPILVVTFLIICVVLLIIIIIASRKK